MEPNELRLLCQEFVNDATSEAYAGDDNSGWSVETSSVAFRTLVLIDKGFGVVCNGGFQYFFENDWPGKPSYSIFSDAFRAIGVSEAADCLDDAVKMFPSKRPHLDFEMRREHMEKLKAASSDGESLIDKLGSRVMELEDRVEAGLAKYVLNQIGAFPVTQTKWRSKIALLREFLGQTL